MFTDNNLLYAVVLVILYLIMNARIAKIEHVNLIYPHYHKSIMMETKFQDCLN